MSEHVLAILVKAVGAQKAAKDLKGVDAVVGGIGAKSGKGLRKIGDNLGRIGVIGAGIAAAGIVASVKAAADFESQMNTINTVAGLTSGKLAEAGAGIRKLARDTGSGLDDLTGAYYDLVSAGIKPGEDALKDLTLANTLAIGGLGTTGEAVDLLTTAINTYHLSTAGAAKATDQFAEAVALGKVTTSELAGSFSTVGPIAQSMGVGINQIAAAYATLTAKGIPAAEAATDMRAALVALAKSTPPLNAAQKKLGVNFQKIARTQGLQAAYKKIVAYSEKSGIPLNKLLGRVEAVQYALSVTGTNAKDYEDALAKVNAANGTAADQMGERQKGLNYQLARLKALAIDAGITLGSKLLPKLTPLVEKAVAFLDTHQADIDKFGDGIAGAFDKALSFSQKIPWGAIGNGLQMAADWAGKLMDAFTSMPPQAQAMIIALAGLNKLSGGAISGIVGEIGKGLIKGVLGMTAGVVNIKAGVVNGGGGIGGGAGAGAGALAGEGLLASVGLTAATMTGLTVGIGTVVAAAILTDRNINDKGGLGPAMQPITNGGATFGTNVTIKDPQIQGARFFGGKGSALVINPNTGGNNIKPGGVSNGPLGEHAAAEATVSAVDRMKNRLAGLLERQQHAKDSGDTGRAHALHAKIVDLKGQIRTSESATARAVADTQRATDRAKAAVDSAKAAQVAQIRATGSTTGVAIGGTTTAVATAQGAIVAALHSIPAPVVNVSVSPTTINKYNTINNRSGSVGGSRGRTNDRGKG